MNTLLTLFNIDRLEEYTRAGFWRDDTFYELVRAHAERAPHRVAVRSHSGDLNYAKLVELADAFASDLEAAGITQGQRVAVWLPSRPETIVALLACSRNGYVCCPSLHRDHTVAEIVDLLKRMRAVALVSQADYGADANKRDLFAQIGEVETLRKLYRLENSAPDRPPGIGALVGTMNATPRGNPNTILYLAFTSGTTGIPKGVMHSDNTLLANARALASDWSIDESSVVYSLSPLSHNLGFGAMIMALGMGGQIVIHDLPRRASLVDRLIETGATFLVGVPTHAVDLLTEMKARNLSGVGKLQGLRIAHAKISDACRRPHSRKRELIVGWIDCHHRRRGTLRNDLLGKGAIPTANIKPLKFFCRVEPGQERLADETAPAPHQPLIDLPIREQLASHATISTRIKVRLTL